MRTSISPKLIRRGAVQTAGEMLDQNWTLDIGTQVTLWLYRGKSLNLALQQTMAWSSIGTLNDAQLLTCYIHGSKPHAAAPGTTHAAASQQNPTNYRPLPRSIHLWYTFPLCPPSKSVFSHSFLCCWASHLSSWNHLPHRFVVWAQRTKISITLIFELCLGYSYARLKAYLKNYQNNLC
jgi:hypothetical protein